MNRTLGGQMMGVMAVAVVLTVGCAFLAAQIGGSVVVVLLAGAMVIAALQTTVASTGLLGVGVVDGRRPTGSVTVPDQRLSMFERTQFELVNGFQRL